MSIKPKLSWSVSWPRKHRSWLKDITITRSNCPGGMGGGQHRWLNRQMPTFKRSFPQASLTDSIKLLPWCVSSTIPLHYMSNALATATEQEEVIPVSIAVPKPEGSQAQDPSDSPAHQTETPPLPVPLLLDIPFVGTALVGCPFAGCIAPLSQWVTWWSLWQKNICWLPRGQG